MMLTETLMHEHNMTFEAAITMNLRIGFIIFAAAACRNGAKMAIPYEAEDRLAKARAEGKNFIIL